MKDKGLACWVVRGDYTMDSGFQQASIMREWKTRPTAVFAANDMMAIGFMMGLSNLGLKVPDDIAVVGCDDIPMAALVKPALTTVRVPMCEIGRRAMELLLEFLRDGEKEPAQSILLNCELVIRESAV
jgi:DNA-binding LacI/PurR family transcriptional regulator